MHADMQWGIENGCIFFVLAEPESPQPQQTATLEKGELVEDMYMYYRIYFIRRRSVYSFQAAGGGRRLLEGGVYWRAAFIHTIINT